MQTLKALKVRFLKHFDCLCFDSHVLMQNMADVKWQFVWWCIHRCMHGYNRCRHDANIDWQGLPDVHVLMFISSKGYNWIWWEICIIFIWCCMHNRCKLGVYLDIQGYGVGGVILKVGNHPLKLRRVGLSDPKKESGIFVSKLLWEVEIWAKNFRKEGYFIWKI